MNMYFTEKWRGVYISTIPQAPHVRTHTHHIVETVLPALVPVVLTPEPVSGCAAYADSDKPPSSHNHDNIYLHISHRMFVCKM